jgi:hypothetical protein
MECLLPFLKKNVKNMVAAHMAGCKFFAALGQA